MSVQLVLDAQGWSLDRFRGHAFVAVTEKLTRMGVTHLEPGLREDVLHEGLEAGLRYALRWRPGGVAFSTWTRQAMERAVIDWYRTRGAAIGFGDRRRGQDGRELLTTSGMMPDDEVMDAESFDAAVDQISAGLPSRSLWTLHHLARPIAEDGVTLDEASAAEGLDRAQAAELLEELGWRLGRKQAQPVERPTIADFALLVAA